MYRSMLPITRVELCEIIKDEGSKPPMDVNLGRIKESISRYENNSRINLTEKDEVIRLICSAFSIDEEDIKIKSNKPHIVNAKFVYALFLQQIIDFSHEEIANEICTPRSTITHGLKRIKEIHITNPFFDRVNDIKKVLNLK